MMAGKDVAEALGNFYRAERGVAEVAGGCFDTAQVGGQGFKAAPLGSAHMESNAEAPCEVAYERFLGSQFVGGPNAVVYPACVKPFSR
jgi:hypothetical protein